MRLFTFEQGSFFSPTPVLNPVSEKADAIGGDSAIQVVRKGHDPGPWLLGMFSTH